MQNKLARGTGWLTPVRRVLTGYTTQRGGILAYAEVYVKSV